MTLVRRITFILIFMTLVVSVVSLFVITGNARHTVNEEMDSRAKTVIQLITAALISVPKDSGAGYEQALVDNFSELQSNQSLRISLRNPASGASTRTVSEFSNDTYAPNWFVKLVAPAFKEYHQRLSIPGRFPIDIVVLANPSDELNETWEESRTMILLVLLFSALSLVLMAVIIRRGLSPLLRIQDGLNEIESGDYSARIAPIKLPELDALAGQFNSMAKRLESQQDENRNLARKMLDIQESERRKLAQELHDELGQSITAIKALAVAQANVSETSVNQTSTILDVCDHMHHSVRSLMHQLRPPILDELGLEPALEKLVDDWNVVHENCFCALSIQGGFSRISDHSRIHLYRIIQEALNNLAKHSNAENATVALRKMGDQVHLDIQDNGQGFEVSSNPHGMGLRGLRERTEACGGQFILASSVGEGVKIQIKMPAVENE